YCECCSAISRAYRRRGYRRSPLPPPSLDGVYECAEDPYGVHPGVGVEAAILGGDDRIPDVVRKFARVDDMASDIRELAHLRLPVGVVDGGALRCRDVLGLGYVDEQVSGDKDADPQDPDPQDRGEEEAPTRQPACDRPLIRPGIVPEAVRLLVAPPPIPRRLGAGGFRTLGCGRRPRLALLTLLRAAIL